MRKMTLTDASQFAREYAAAMNGSGELKDVIAKLEVHTELAEQPTDEQIDAMSGEIDRLHARFVESLLVSEAIEAAILDAVNGGVTDEAI